MRPIASSLPIRSIALVLLVGSLACSDRSPTSPSPEPPAEPQDPSVTILPSGTGGYSGHLQFLPPLVDDEPAEPFENDPGFLADLTVEICEWDGSACVGEAVARFTAGDPPQSRNLRVEEDEDPGHFIANWQTKGESIEAGALYRIRVSAGTIDLGHQDVKVVGARDDAATGSVPTVRIRSTLPIKFRVRQDRIEGSPQVPVATELTGSTFTPRAEDYRGGHPQLGDVPVSFNTMLLMFEPTTTLAQANAVLDAVNAFVVGAIADPSGEFPGILALRLPTTTHEGMTEALELLRSLSTVQTAVQDLLLSPLVVTDEEGATSGWTWERSPSGGNWGLEASKIPEMWNLNVGIRKAMADGSLAPPPEILVYDAGFADAHEDLAYAERLTPTDPDLGYFYRNHGTHVAGTIGATFDNGLGIDGVNPWARLVVARNDVNSTAAWVFEYTNVLSSRPDVRVVNMSLGWEWWGFEDTDAASTIANQFGALVSGIHAHPDALLGGRLPQFVAAAGNDGMEHARNGSPWTNAALVYGDASIVVVEAHDQNLQTAPFSNDGGHVSAPGVGVLSTVVGGFGIEGVYDENDGTSMAAPHVAGLLSYILTLDPSLPDPTQNDNPVRGLLLTNATGSGDRGEQISAFPTVMDVDRLQGDDRVLRMLLDFDDGTPDGNRRVDPGTESPYLAVDADGDGGPGDGRIDMSDFRRWRDWYLDLRHGSALALQQSFPIALDGGSAHPKRDANGDGVVEIGFEYAEETYSRGDLNGDGYLSADSPASVPGALMGGELTDLQVLQSRFDDLVYDAAELDELLVSADARVDGSQCLGTFPNAQITSSIRVRTGTKEVRGISIPTYFEKSVDLTTDAPIGVLTAPLGESEPLPSVIVRVEARDPSGTVLSSASETVDLLPGGDFYWTPTCEAASANESPSATITSPDDGASFTDGETIAFEGSGSDPEDGTLTGSSLVWTSDLDGQLGTGTSVSTSLSVGTHSVTLTATDSDGATGSESVTVTVDAAPAGAGGVLVNVSPDGVDVTNDQIFRVSPDGSEVIALTGDDPDDPDDEFFARGWSPDGREILYSDIDRRDSGGGDLYRMNRDGSGKTQLTDSPNFREGDASWSPAGDLIAFWSRPSLAEASEIYVMNPDGSGTKRLTSNQLRERQPVWSPTGDQIAFVRRSYNGERYVHHIVKMKVDGTSQVELTSGASSNTHPVWSPAGDKIAFYSDRDDVYQSCALHVMNADGSGLVRLLDPTPAQCGSLAEHATWSPDGKRLAVLRTPDGDPITPAEIWVVAADGSGAVNITNDGPARDYDPVWSPDGTRIIYGSNPNDRTLAKLYIMNADGTNDQVLADPGLVEKPVGWQ